jgi:hypothetical protein
MSFLLNPIFALLVLATCLLADDTSSLHSPTVHHASAHRAEKATKQVEGQPAVEAKASAAPIEAQLSKLEREMVKVEAKFTEYKKTAKAERADLEKLMVEDEKHSLELDAVVDAGFRRLDAMLNSWHASPQRKQFEELTGLNLTALVELPEAEREAVLGAAVKAYQAKMAREAAVKAYQAKVALTRESRWVSWVVVATAVVVATVVVVEAVVLKKRSLSL